jgi:hypothetical protein
MLTLPVEKISTNTLVVIEATSKYPYAARPTITKVITSRMKSLICSFSSSFSLLSSSSSCYV